MHGGGLFSERERVEERARRRGRRRAEVEDPNHLDDTEQDETSSGGLTRSTLLVDERMDCNASQDHSSRAVARQSDVVGVDGVAGHDDEDDDVQEQSVHHRPPGEKVEVSLICELDVGGDEPSESDEPCKLAVSAFHLSIVKCSRRTMAMEMVARAKGSPRMLPIWIPFLRLPYREFSIFLRDGEYNEP